MLPTAFFANVVFLQRVKVLRDHRRSFFLVLADVRGYPTYRHIPRKQVDPQCFCSRDVPVVCCSVENNFVAFAGLCCIYIYQTFAN